MIVESLLDLFMNMILGVLDTITMVPLPIALTDVLVDIFCYGSWVVGADFMTMFMSTVVFWFTARFAIGIIVFLWELIPGF